MRRFDHTDFGDLDLSAVSVVMPAQDCAQTIGAIVESIDAGQLLVVDAASADGTAEVAARAGAEVVQQADLLPESGPVLGKGDAMWRALSAVRHDVVVYVDVDTPEFDAHFVTGLAGPLVTDPEIQFVKAGYTRPVTAGSGLEPQGGGRVTELMARPLLRAFYPELAELVQPLAAEFAGRRELFERVSWVTGYAAELALVIDIWREIAGDAMAQVDIGDRHQPHRQLESLSRRASATLAVVCSRLVAEGRMEPGAAPGVDFAVRPPIRDQISA